MSELATVNLSQYPEYLFVNDRDKALEGEEIAQRVRFVKEYLRDHNIVAACRRAGFPHKAATQMVDNFYYEPLIQAMLVDALEAPITEQEKQSYANKLARKIMMDGVDLDASPETSVQTAAVMVKLTEFGGDAANAAEAVAGGVMRVPYIDGDEWEKFAKQSQSQLKRKAIKQAEVSNSKRKKQ